MVMDCVGNEVFFGVFQGFLGFFWGFRVFSGFFVFLDF